MTLKEKNLMIEDVLRKYYELSNEYVDLTIVNLAIYLNEKRKKVLNTILIKNSINDKDPLKREFDQRCIDDAISIMTIDELLEYKKEALKQRIKKSSYNDEIKKFVFEKYNLEF